RLLLGFAHGTGPRFERRRISRSCSYRTIPGSINHHGKTYCFLSAFADRLFRFDTISGLSDPARMSAYRRRASSVPPSSAMAATATPKPGPSLDVVSALALPPLAFPARSVPAAVPAESPAVVAAPPAVVSVLDVAAPTVVSPLAVAAVPAVAPVALLPVADCVVTFPISGVADPMGVSERFADCIASGWSFRAISVSESTTRGAGSLIKL